MTTVIKGRLAIFGLAASALGLYGAGIVNQARNQVDTENQVDGRILINCSEISGQSIQERIDFAPGKPVAFGGYTDESGQPTGDYVRMIPDGNDSLTINLGNPNTNVRFGRGRYVSFTSSRGESYYVEPLVDGQHAVVEIYCPPGESALPVASRR